ncbi:OTU domain-containing protein 7B, partial [Frankliniella fusca]
DSYTNIKHKKKPQKKADKKSNLHTENTSSDHSSTTDSSSDTSSTPVKTDSKKKADTSESESCSESSDDSSEDNSSQNSDSSQDINSLDELNTTQVHKTFSDIKKESTQLIRITKHSGFHGPYKTCVGTLKDNRGKTMKVKMPKPVADMNKKTLKKTLERIRKKKTLKFIVTGLQKKKKATGKGHYDIYDYKFNPLTYIVRVGIQHVTDFLYTNAHQFCTAPYNLFPGLYS